jgi:hypothetical protein
VAVHIHTQTIRKITQITTNVEDSGPCPVFTSFTLAFALQLRKEHGKTSVKVRKTSVRLRKTSVTVMYTYYRVQYTHSHIHIPAQSIAIRGDSFEIQRWKVVTNYFIFWPVLSVYSPKHSPQNALQWKIADVCRCHSRTAHNKMRPCYTFIATQVRWTM